MRIGIDFDDVVYPYHTFLRRKIHERWGIDYSDRRVTTFFYNEMPELAAKGVTRDQVWALVQETWMDAADHAEAAPLDPGIPDVVKRLRRRHNVELVSARAEESRHNVEEFLERFGIEVDRIVLGQGRKVGYDVLIDDFPAHAVENAESGGHSILFTINENSTFDEDVHPRIHRAHGWEQVESLLLQLESEA